MKNLSKVKLQSSLVLMMSIFFSSAFAQIGAWNPLAEEKAQKVIETFKEKNSKMESYFEDSYGYVIFPSIGKGAVGFGGAYGRGLVYENDQLIGNAKMTQVTLGFQWGGQAYSEVIFFEDEAALNSFKGNNLEFSGQASAVAAIYGASADIAYEHGVAVYTIAKGGLMYEASLGGQKFKFRENEELINDASDIVTSE
jgi:lipid-binding SYLF domain-containing protein